MKAEDDLEDGSSREANRKFLLTADRATVRPVGRWVPHHPYRATLWDSVMSILGAIILAAVLIALLVEHFTHR